MIFVLFVGLSDVDKYVCVCISNNAIYQLQSSHMDQYSEYDTWQNNRTFLISSIWGTAQRSTEEYRALSTASKVTGSKKRQ